MNERKFVQENIKRVLLKEYLRRATDAAGFGGIEIQRTPLGTRIILEVEKPGLVIGKKGDKIKEITSVIEKEYKIENPQIEVKQSEKPNLNSLIMAKKIASALESGWHFRRAGHSTLKRIMDSGAKGAQITIGGRIGGDRGRREKFTAGKIKYSGKPAESMFIGYAVAKTKPGIIGVTVKILTPDKKLPDEITIVEKKEVKESNKDGRVKNEGDTTVK
jgi:small subunit ribosomal protein S3